APSVLDLRVSGIDVRHQLGQELELADRRSGAPGSRACVELARKTALDLARFGAYLILEPVERRGVAAFRGVGNRFASFELTLQKIQRQRRGGFRERVDTAQ